MTNTEPMKSAPEPRRPPEECSRCHHVRQAVVISHFKPICAQCWSELNNPQKPVNFSGAAAYWNSGAPNRARMNDE